MQAGSADASPTSGSSPSATTYRRSAADRAGGEVKNRTKRSFLDKILDNCIWFLHGIGFLFDFLRRCHLRQHAGQEVMSSDVLSCPMGAQGCTGPVGRSDNLEVL